VATGLLDRLTLEEDGEVRKAVIFALGHHLDAQAALLLLSYLESPAHEGIWMDVATALGGAPKEVLPHLERCLLNLRSGTGGDAPAAALARSIKGIRGELTVADFETPFYGRME
jgi:HEAT repeat protein